MKNKKYKSQIDIRGILRENIYKNKVHENKVKCLWEKTILFPLPRLLHHNKYIQLSTNRTKNIIIMSNIIW